MDLVMKIYYLDNYSYHNWGPIDYAIKGDACMDLRAAPNDQNIVIYPGNTEKIPLGIKVAVPESHVMLLFGRSGLSSKFGITLANKVGIIDPTYRGEIMASLKNESVDTRIVWYGNRIVQALIIPAPKIEAKTVLFESELGETERGSGGFGHTGK